jgi:hypothetical protein
MNRDDRRRTALLPLSDLSPLARSPGRRARRPSRTMIVRMTVILIPMRMKMRRQKKKKRRMTWRWWKRRRQKWS